MTDHGYTTKIKRLGIPDAVIEHGTQLELQKQCGFDPEGIMQASLDFVGVPSSVINDLL